MKLTTGIKARALGLVAGVLLASVTIAGSLQGAGQGQGGRGQGGMQGPRGGMRGGPQSLAQLATRPDVAREIGLTQQQGEAIRAAIEESRPPRPEQPGGQRPDRDAMREQREAMMRALDAKLAQILSPAQLTRVEEISIQLRGLTAALDPKVQAKLALTEQQKEALSQLAPTPGRPGGPGGPDGPPPPPGEGGQGGPPPPPGEGGGQGGRQGRGQGRGQGGRGQGGPGGMDPWRQQLEARIAEILTDAQEARLKALGGKTFTPDRRGPGRPGRPGGPGGPGGPGSEGEQAFLDGLLG